MSKSHDVKKDVKKEAAKSRKKKKKLRKRKTKETILALRRKVFFEILLSKQFFCLCKRKPLGCFSLFILSFPLSNSNYTNLSSWNRTLSIPKSQTTLHFLSTRRSLVIV